MSNTLIVGIIFLVFGLIAVGFSYYLESPNNAYTWNRVLKLNEIEELYKHLMSKMSKKLKAESLNRRTK